MRRAMPFSWCGDCSALLRSLLASVAAAERALASDSGSWAGVKHDSLPAAKMRAAQSCNIRSRAPLATVVCANFDRAA